MRPPLPAQVCELLAQVDHVEARQVDSAHELAPFVERLLSFQPTWLRRLFQLRAWLLRLIGHQTGTPARERVQFSATPGERVGFLTVTAAGRDFWAGGAHETHLSFYLAVVQQVGQLRVLTLVQFHNRFGRWYFALIRPFHGLVMRAMLRGAAKALCCKRP